MNDKVLLILGASSDTGIELINSVYKKYDKIYAQYYSNSEELEQLKQMIGSKLITIKANFLSDSSVDEMIQFLAEQEVDIAHVVHISAPKIRNIKLKDIYWKSYEDDINIQIKSIFKVIKLVIPKMSKNKYGKIVFMLSSCVVNDPPKYLNNYVTIKYALLGFMKALAVEYAPMKININAVSPSMMETKFLDNVPELVVQANRENSPMKRNATVQDVVPTIDFLLSDYSSYITGQNIIISGGNK